MTDLTAKTNPEQASHAMHRELSQTEDDASLILSRVEALYEQGRYVDALEASKPLGPVTTWSSPAGRVMAGRLAGNLGAPRLGRALHWLAGRNDDSHPAVLYYSAMAYWSRFGTLHAWRRYQAVDMPSDATASQKADWLALKATMLAWMRDFSRAEPLSLMAHNRSDTTNARLREQIGVARRIMVCKNRDGRSNSLAVNLTGLI
jgi:hypothetical protein